MEHTYLHFEHLKELKVNIRLSAHFTGRMPLQLKHVSHFTRKCNLELENANWKWHSSLESTSQENATSLEKT